MMTRPNEEFKAAVRQVVRDCLYFKGPESFKGTCEELAVSRILLHAQIWDIDRLREEAIADDTP